MVNSVQIAFFDLTAFSTSGMKLLNSPFSGHLAIPLHNLVMLFGADVVVVVIDSSISEKRVYFVTSLLQLIYVKQVFLFDGVKAHHVFRQVLCYFVATFACGQLPLELNLALLDIYFVRLALADDATNAHQGLHMHFLLLLSTF